MVQNEICRVLKAVAYLIDAWIRDGYHADTENSDDSKMLSCVIFGKFVL